MVNGSRARARAVLPNFAAALREVSFSALALPHVASAVSLPEALSTSLSFDGDRRTFSPFLVFRSFSLSLPFTSRRAYRTAAGMCGRQFTSRSRAGRVAEVIRVGILQALVSIIPLSGRDVGRFGKRTAKNSRLLIATGRKRQRDRRCMLEV